MVLDSRISLVLSRSTEIASYLYVSLLAFVYASESFIAVLKCIVICIGS
jgi:hypothetical protein